MIICIAFLWGSHNNSVITVIILFICLLFSSVVITGLGTSLIILRILSVTQNNPSIGSRAPYKRIQRIFLESGIIYSIGMLITGITLAANITQTAHRLLPPQFLFQIVTYSEALLTPFAVSTLTHALE